MRLSAIVGQSRMPRADVALALGVGAFAALLLWEAEKIPPPFFDPLGSAAVPQGVAVVLLALGAIVFLRALAARPWPARPEPEGYRPRPDVAVGIAILAVGYIAVMELGLLGFRDATIAFVALASAVLGRLSPRIMLTGLLVAVIVGFGGTYLFTRVFIIALP